MFTLGARRQDARVAPGSFRTGVAALRRRRAALPVAQLGRVVRADADTRREACGHAALLPLRSAHPGRDRGPGHRARAEPVRRQVGEAGEADPAVRRALHALAIVLPRILHGPAARIASPSASCWSFPLAATAATGGRTRHLAR